jgi:hypothetical protein
MGKSRADFHLPEEGREVHVDGAVHHDAERAALVVLGHTSVRVRDLGPTSSAWR